MANNIPSPNMKYLCGLLSSAPDAAANIQGNGINGRVYFYQTDSGTVVAAEVTGLPQNGKDICDQNFYGFHIHDGNTCTGTKADPFAGTKGHYNPGNCSHPNHAGDLPPLLGNEGKAVSVFLTGRFSVEDVLGKTVVIHEKADDFTTQPAGNSGMKIACGVINII